MPLDQAQADTIAESAVDSMRDLGDRVLDSSKKNASAARRDVAAYLDELAPKFKIAAAVLLTASPAQRLTHANTLRGLSEAFNLNVLRNAENLSEGTKATFRSGLLSLTDFLIRLAIAL